MNLEQFGEELKQARIEKKMSLVDISAETRINLKFLEAIEHGQFQILPQTYVRAFLREYALLLNLDPSDITQRYNSARQEEQSRKPEEGTSQHLSMQSDVSSGYLKDRFNALTHLQRNLVLGVFIVAAIALVAVLANVNRGLDSARPVVEVPFDRVVRESEAASIPPPSTVDDSAPAVPVPQKDSLYLEITTLDSVWMSILIDGKKAEEHLFGANKKRTWAAKERFVVTMGNANGATFQLNGKDIGSLGARGGVVRNAVITEANLKN
jgi:cytoskeleton protein RodZ